MHRTAFACFFILLASSAARGQSQPDFSGTWEMEASLKGSHETALPGRVTLIIAQTPAEVNIETRNAAAGKDTIAREVLTYKLDGSENTMQGTSGTPITTKARWDGPKLVTETVRTINSAAITTVHTLSLNSTKRELTVDKTLIVQHGYRSLVPRNTGTGKEVYTRARVPAR